MEKMNTKKKVFTLSLILTLANLVLPQFANASEMKTFSKISYLNEATYKKLNDKATLNCKSLTMKKESVENEKKLYQCVEKSIGKGNIDKYLQTVLADSYENYVVANLNVIVREANALAALKETADVDLLDEAYQSSDLANYVDYKISVNSNGLTFYVAPSKVTVLGKVFNFNPNTYTVSLENGHFTLSFTNIFNNKINM